MTEPPSDEEISQMWAEITSLASALMDRSRSFEPWQVGQRSELASDDALTAPCQVSHAVEANLGAAIDNLHAACALLEGGFLHTYAVSTLFRATLESACTAIWILVPSERTTRIERTLRWNARDYADEDAFAAHVMINRRPTEQTSDRIRALAEANSVPIERALKPYYSTAAVRAADDVTEFGDFLGLFSAWQLASGYAHARRWAVISTANTRIKSVSPSGVLNISFEQSRRMLTLVAMPALNAVREAMRLFEIRAASPQALR